MESAVPDSQIAERIHACWPSLTRSDRLVARSLLAGYPLTGLKTLAEVAQRAGVSAPSVIRCVKKLGYEGYPEFQDALHLEVQQAFDGFGEAAAGGGPATAEARDLAAGYLRGIERTVGSVATPVNDELGAHIARQKAGILCLGGPVSQALAVYFESRLRGLRPGTELVSAVPVERAGRLRDIERGDVVVLFDYRPFDPQATAFARLATERKATLVCFTDLDPSPAAEFADYLVGSDNPEIDGEPSLTGALCSAELVLRGIREKLEVRNASRTADVGEPAGSALSAGPGRY